MVSWPPRVLLLATLLAAPGISADDSGAGEVREIPKRAASEAELLLVRTWNPKTGELTGWMPTHRLAMTLQQLGAPTASFDLNEAMYFPSRPARVTDGEGVRIAPRAVSFEGRIGSPSSATQISCGYINFFSISTIVFGDSKWRRSAIVAECPKGKRVKLAYTNLARTARPHQGSAPLQADNGSSVLLEVLHPLKTRYLPEWTR
jgi:hypothetical protein